MFTQDDFAKQTSVSRETLADYGRWFALIQKWNATINLVSRSAMDDVWRRHLFDSWQITPKIPENAEKCVDFGSGGGFPGLSVGIYLKYKGVGHVTMIESAGKKAHFLRTVVRELDLPVTVLSERIEKTDPFDADLVTARAFAPLPRLFQYAAPFWAEQTIGLFHKGETVGSEIEDAKKAWSFTTESFPSLSHEAGSVLRIEALQAL